MKEVIKHTVKHLVLGILATAAVLAVFTLCLAMPNILEWVAGYIGEFTTWVVFIFIVGAVIAYCIAE